MATDTPPRRGETPAWLFGAVLVLLAVAPGQLAYAVDRKHGPFIAYADLLAALVIAVWGLRVLLTGRLRQLTWPPRQTWALLVVAVLSGLGAESLKLAALEIIQLGLYFVLAYMLFADVVRDAPRQRAALLVLLAATSLVVLYGLTQYLRAQNAFEVKATFQSRGAYSAYLVMVLPLCYGLLLRSARLWERLWAGAALTIGALTILSPLLVFVLVLVLGAVTLAWGRRGSLVRFAAGAGAFCVLTMLWAPLNRAVWHETLNPYEEGPIYKTMGAAATGDATATEGADAAATAGGHPVIKKRWIEWMPALNMMAENFLLGVGTGNYQLNIGRPEYYGFLPNVKKSEPDTNNLYLVTGSSMGFAGLVCLLGFVGYFARRALTLWTHLADHQEWAFAAGLYGVALGIPLANVFSSLFVRGTSLVWAFAYAMIVVLGQPRGVPAGASAIPPEAS
jgi:hypothetical protein